MRRWIADLLWAFWETIGRRDRPLPDPEWTACDGGPPEKFTILHEDGCPVRVMREEEL